SGIMRAKYGRPVIRCHTSGPHPAARTRTSTSPCPTTGSGTSRSLSTSGEPYASCTIAFMRPPLPLLDDRRSFPGSGDRIGVPTHQLPDPVLATENAGASKRDGGDLSAASNLCLDALGLDRERHVGRHACGDRVEARRATVSIECRGPLHRGCDGVESPD